MVATVSVDDALVPNTRLVELRDPVRLVEEAEAEMLTTPLNPPRLVMLIVETSEDPTRKDRLVALESTLKSTT